MANGIKGQGSFTRQFLLPVLLQSLFWPVQPRREPRRWRQGQQFPQEHPTCCWTNRVWFGRL